MTLVSDCGASFYLKQQLKSSLSATDFATLKPTRQICPIEYAYMRDGNKEQAIALPSLLQTKIYYAAENHQP